MTIRLNKERFKALLIRKCFESDNGTVVKLSDVLAVLGSLQCKNEPCTNEARYSSGYCGICDIEFDGQGVRITHPET